MLFHSQWLSVLSFLTVVLLADYATPLEIWDDMVVKHTWHTVPVNWETLGHPPAGTRIDLNIAFKPQRESALVDTLLEVSNPDHARYGAHLSADQVAELVRPFPDTIELITAWLEYHDIRSSFISKTHSGAWLTVPNVLVSQANQLLGASYQLYRNVNTNDTIVRTVGYALPAALHKHIKTVAPTTYFASRRVTREALDRRTFEPAQAQELSNRADPYPGEEFILNTYKLRWLYRAAEYEPSAMYTNKLAVVGFQDEFAGQADLTTFMKDYDRKAEDARFTLVHVNGGVDNPNIPDIKGSAAIQYAAGMSFPTPLTFYNVGGKLEWDGGALINGDMILAWTRYVLDEPRPLPQTVSIAYGEDESYLPEDYAESLCEVFADFGARGVSILVASGDFGVGKGSCENNDGDIRYRPQFPASCPWVTSVGGTQGGLGGLSGPEVAAGLSGGGFSEYFGRPRYQKDAVLEFLQRENIRIAEFFFIFGRGYPDIAAQASYFHYVRGVTRIDNGTVCAVSTVAGIISLINDFRISQQMRPLGFLNPWLYGIGRPGLKDITSGPNPGCNMEGFSAITGWDPVTGLGTPNLQRLLENLPPPEYSGIDLDRH